MQIATLKERGVTLLDGSLVFSLGLSAPCFDIGAKLGSPPFALYCSTALRLELSRKRPKGPPCLGLLLSHVGSAAAAAATANAPCLASERSLWRSGRSRMNGGHRPTSLAPGGRPWETHGGCACGLQHASIPLILLAVAYVNYCPGRSMQQAGGPLCITQLFRMQFCLHMRPRQILHYRPHMQCDAPSSAHHPREHAGLVPGEANRPVALLTAQALISAPQQCSILDKYWPLSQTTLVAPSQHLIGRVRAANRV